MRINAANPAQTMETKSIFDLEMNLVRAISNMGNDLNIDTLVKLGARLINIGIADGAVLICQKLKGKLAELNSPAEANRTDLLPDMIERREKLTKTLTLVIPKMTSSIESLLVSSKHYPQKDYASYRDAILISLSNSGVVNTDNMWARNILSIKD